jgi:beta-mannosidase
MQSILPEFGDPTSLDEFIMLSQEAQATLMRYAVEVYRRRMFKTSGSLIWQYDDPWPAVTFSLVDHFGRQKAAYYWVKDAHAPVMGMFYSGNGNLEYWGVSDLAAEQACSLRIRRFAHSGALLGEAAFTGLLHTNTSTRLVDVLPGQLLITSSANEFLHAELVAGGRLSEQVHHLGNRRDWELQETRIDAHAEQVGEACVRVRLTSKTYAHFVQISVADPLARYSANAVDLMPGEAREIVIRTGANGPVTIRSANAPVVVVEV